MCRIFELTSEQSAESPVQVSETGFLPLYGKALSDAVKRANHLPIRVVPRKLQLSSLSETKAFFVSQKTILKGTLQV